MFLTSSKHEYKSIFEYPYNYKREVIKLLGFPRFDSLEKKEDKRQIFIMPSWRRYLRFKSNEYILNSQHFIFLEIHFTILFDHSRILQIIHQTDF